MQRSRKRTRVTSVSCACVPISCFRMSASSAAAPSLAAADSRIATSASLLATSSAALSPGTGSTTTATGAAAGGGAAPPLAVEEVEEAEEADDLDADLEGVEDEGLCCCCSLMEGREVEEVGVGRCDFAGCPALAETVSFGGRGEDGVGPPVVVVEGDDDAFLEGAAVLRAEGEEASEICAGE